jgi:PPOX class F420-dependent enzyme/OxyR family protein/uncharacterized protein (TIGR02246 family)
VTTQVLDAALVRYLGEQQRGVLTTIAVSGWPQTKPVGFRYDPQRARIDVSGYDMERSVKFGNVAANPRVVFTVNDVTDPELGAEGVRFLEIRGVAEQVRLPEPVMPGISRWILRIHPRRLVSYNVAGAGMRTADLTGEEATDGETRPVIGLGGGVAERARRAVKRQVTELQAGLDAGDADTYNGHFAADVMWGSPYGATVAGYDTLHAIHARLQAADEHRRSRYEIVRVLAATPDVALAQVRRDALDAHGEPIPSRDGEPRFSEMALYVLVRRDGAWWLAAGHP